MSLSGQYSFWLLSYWKRNRKGLKAREAALGAAHPRGFCFKVYLLARDLVRRCDLYN